MTQTVSTASNSSPSSPRLPLNCVRQVHEFDWPRSTRWRTRQSLADSRFLGIPLSCSSVMALPLFIIMVSFFWLQYYIPEFQVHEPKPQFSHGWGAPPIKVLFICDSKYSISLCSQYTSYSKIISQLTLIARRFCYVPQLQSNTRWSGGIAGAGGASGWDRVSACTAGTN